MDSHISSNSQCRWLHVLLRGQAGESERCQRDEYVQEFAEKSLDAMHLPILEFTYKNLELLKDQLNGINGQKSGEATGLIVTSPRVVEAIRRSLDQRELSILPTGLNQSLVFAVGSKTAEECDKKLNLGCNNRSSDCSNSADLATIIKSACETIHQPIRLVYPKSSLADTTIEDLLAKCEHVQIQVVIAYETRPLNDLETILSDAIGRHLASDKFECLEHICVNLIFFSPSGVEGYTSQVDQERLMAELTGYIQTTKGSCSQVALKHSCIGKTTEAALRRSNLNVLCVANKPNARSLVDAVLKSCSL